MFKCDVKHAKHTKGFAKWIEKLLFSLIIYGHSIDDITPLINSINELNKGLPDNYKSVLAIYDASNNRNRAIKETELREWSDKIEIIYKIGKNVGYGREIITMRSNMVLQMIL